MNEKNFGNFKGNDYYCIELKFCKRKCKRTENYGKMYEVNSIPLIILVKTMEIVLKLFRFPFYDDTQQKELRVVEKEKNDNR